MTMLEEVRAKWCDSLVDLLECPVCNEIPKRYIYQCMSGHHICKDCRNKIIKCPICQDAFGGSRNYLAEELSDILENITISLKYPTHKINKRIFQDKICVHTQTQEICKQSIEVQTENLFLNENKFTQTRDNSINKHVGVQTQTAIDISRKNNKKFYPKIARGAYPCRIGSCTTKLPYTKMIEHLKSSHANAFFIFQEKKGIFEKKSELKYNVPENYDLAFLIRNMGLFFVNITILSTGDVTGAVYIVNSASASKQFMFALAIGSGEKATRYFGTVKSCRESRIQAMRDCLFKKNVEMNEILLRNRKFKCDLIIKRSNPSGINHNHIKCE